MQQTTATSAAIRTSNSERASSSVRANDTALILTSVSIELAELSERGRSCVGVRDSSTITPGSGDPPQGPYQNFGTD
jgi:hypothetical protein